MVDRPSLTSGLGRIAPFGMAALIAIAVGAGLAVQARALVLLLLPLALFVLPPARSAQALLAIALLKGATAPFGELFGLDLVHIAIWLVLPLLYFTERAQGARPTTDSSVMAAVAAYTGCLLVANLFHPGSAALTSTLSLVNYVGIFLLTVLLARRRPILLVVPLLAALTIHEAIAAAELLRNSAWFYGEWKTLEATKVAGITRVASTVADPNYFAVTLILLASTLLTVAKGTHYHRFAVAAAAGAALLLPFTFSRAGAIALLVALVAAAVRTRKVIVPRLALRGAAFVVCTSLAILFIAPSVPGALLSRYSPSQGSDASIESRSALQKFGLEQALAHPVVGIGSGAFEGRARALYDPAKPDNRQTDVLNAYLQVWLAGGALALVTFIAILLLSTWKLIRARLTLGFCLLGVAVALLTLNGLTLVPLWFALGLAAVLAATSGPAHAPTKGAG